MTTGSNFYVTGGTLRYDAPSYIERQADRALLEGLLKGDFCYVLTPRQMGKSSLMVRTASKLREQGANVIALDLTAIGQNLKLEQWYNGLLLRLGQQLQLEDALDAFWQANERLGPVQRLFTALRAVAMKQRPGRFVIFVDEIDTVRSLPFSTGEFFAAIRECYNRRAEDPEFNRLTFCLLGVATPTDLIRDTKTTPFNIGRRVELHDFTEDEAAPLANGLRSGDRAPAPARDEEVRQVLRRILDWTGGHPYLTQRLCRAVAEAASARPQALPGGPNGALVDRLCDELFLSTHARERDDNLIFVRERILRADADLVGLLDLYLRVHRGKPVADDPANPLVSLLRLSGIIRVERGRLQVRNRIYAEVFDRNWVITNMPDSELRRQRRAFRKGLVRGAGVALAALLLLGAGLVTYYSRRQAQEAQRTIQNLGAVYSALTSYQDTAVIKQDLQMGGAKVATDGEIRIIFQRPNKFNLTIKMRMPFGQTDVRVIGDGTTIWGYVPAAKQYIVRPSPAALSEILQRISQISTLNTIPLTLYGIIASRNPQEAFAKRARDVRLLRTEVVGGKPAYVFAWKEAAGPPPEMDGARGKRPSTGLRYPVTAWVSKEDGLVRRWVMDLSAVAQRTAIPNLAGGAPFSVSLGQLVVALNHNDIRLNPPLPADTFTFTPPADAKLVEDVDDATILYASRSADVEPKFDRQRLAQLVSPRTPQARRELIDLSPHYNAPLTLAWHSDRPGNDLATLPQGVQKFGEVEFDVRGIIQLAGRAEYYLRAIFPAEVQGIKVGLKCHRLHFLHATGWSAPDGTQVGHYLICYANGQQRACPILYGFDVRNWWPQGNEPPPETTGVTVAWTNTMTPGGLRRLYHSTWTNPLPDVEITSIDYVSSMADPAPFLIAITAE